MRDIKPDEEITSAGPWVKHAISLSSLFVVRRLSGKELSVNKTCHAPQHRHSSGWLRLFDFTITVKLAQSQLKYTEA